MKLAEIGVKRPVATAMVFLVVLILGLVSLGFLPVDLMPEIELPAITVVTIWYGASAEDVENKVTRVIENDLSIVNNLDKIYSETREGVSRVTCQFNWGTDLDEASNDIRDRLEFSKRDLPDDVEQPIIQKFNSSLSPVIFYAITAQESWERLDDIVSNDIADALKRVPGVGAVESFGGLTRQINITLDRARLAGYGLSLKDVENVLRSENLTLPAGTLKIGTTAYTIRVPGEYESPAQIRDVVLKRQGSAIVYLRDVASVDDAFREVTRIAESGGRRAIMMMVQKRSGANTVQVCGAVREAMVRMQDVLPRDIRSVAIYDASDFIRQSLSNVTRTVLWGGLFVVLTTFFFLRSLRTSATIVLTVPFALIIAFAFMYLMGWTLNVMSLAAMAIAIGMVVDNAVVVLENISQHIERGEKVRDAAMFGTEEIGMAIASSTLTTVVVFLPLIFVSGVAGIMFKQLGGIITVTLMASLLCAVMLTPMLCSVLMRRDEFSRARKGFNARFFAWSERIFLSLENGYEALLGWALNHRARVVLVALAMFSGSLVLVPLIGSEFSPEQDTGSLNVTFEMPVGTRVEVTADMCRKIADLGLTLAGSNNMKSVSWRCGVSESGFGSGRQGSHAGTVMFRLVSVEQRKQSTKDVGRAIADQMRLWPEIERVFASTQTSIPGMPGSNQKPIIIEILGHDLVQSEKIALQIQALVQSINGAKDVTVSYDTKNPMLMIRIDRQKASSMGLNVAHVVESMRTYFYGKEASRYREGENEYDIFMQLSEAQRQSFENLMDSEIVTPDGHRIRLDSVARIEETRGPLLIERKNQERLIKVELDAFGRSVGEVVADIRKTIANNIDLPAGVTIEYGGQVEEQSDSFQALGLLLLLGILLVYMVMAGQFESFLNPFIIMFSVPFAFTGVALALAVTGISLSIMSLIGMILLVGTAVNNAIVLLDYTNLMRERGIELTQAIRRAGRSRLRPVLITTLTTVFGMLPMALSRSEGAETWRPLGVTVIGGLSMATLVTMVLVPVIYSLTERFRTKNPGRESVS